MTARSTASRRPARRAARKTPQQRLWGKDTLAIERMSEEGRGVARREGKIVFVSGALEGEQVSVQCTAVNKGYDEATMIARIADTAPNPERVSPACAIYADCGGCSLQHWSLEAQQQHKQATLLAKLQPMTPLQLEPPILSAGAGFRHRLRLMVTRAPDRRYLLALRQHRSHEAVTLAHCTVANAAVNAAVKALPAQLLNAPDLQGLREIEIDADSDNRIGLCFYFAANPGEKVLAALRTAVLVAPVVALRVRLNAQRKARGESLHDEWGEEEVNLRQELMAEGDLCLRSIPQASEGEPTPAALELRYQPGDFTQTHWQVNTELVARALDWLRPGSDEIALDLFSGIGNFSLPLARHARTVHAFESDSGMTARVTANAQRNGITNVRAVTRNLMAGEVELPRADIAVIDPPRAGARAACEALARAKVKRIVYVSCHPATLLRDAQILQQAGYRLSKAAAVDMFPHTGHSEAIALFQRGK